GGIPRSWLDLLRSRGSRGGLRYRRRSASGTEEGGDAGRSIPLDEQARSHSGAHRHGAGGLGGTREGQGGGQILSPQKYKGRNQPRRPSSQARSRPRLRASTS